MADKDNIIEFPNGGAPLTDQEEASTLLEMLPNFEGQEEMAALLALPEEEFKQFAPVVLMELERSINNTSDKLLLIQGLNAAGIKAEDMITAGDAINNYLDEELGSIQQIKKDFVNQVVAMICNGVADTEGLAKRVISIPVEFCNPDAKMPEYAHMSDSGLDVYAVEDVRINPGETVLVKTGLKVAIPIGYELQVRPKSGRALKTKMRVANTPGTIDAGYRDEIGIIIDNIEPPIKDITVDDDGKVTSILYGAAMNIEKGEKIAQLVLTEIPKAYFYQVEQVSDIGEDRGGGFGSTGVK